MLNQMAELTMHRNEELRTHQIVHQLDFLLTGMAGYMDAITLFINHIRTQLVQMVNGPRNQLFVTGNRSCRNNHRITGHNVHFLVVIHSHAGQGTHGLALATGGNNHYLIRSIIARLVNINNLALRSLQIAQLLGDAHYIHHAAANNCHLAVIFHSRINNLLNTMHIG